MDNTFSFDDNLIIYCDIRESFEKLYYELLSDLNYYKSMDTDDLEEWTTRLSQTFKHDINKALKVSSAIVVSLGGEKYPTHGDRPVDYSYSELSIRYPKDYIDIEKFNRLIPDCDEYIHYTDLFDFSEYEKAMREACENLRNQENAMQIRKLSRQSKKSHWVGGGFGLEGAIKGAAMAGALNLGSSLMHGIGRGIGNSIDRAKLANSRSKIINIVKKDKYYDQALHNCITGVFEVTILELERQGLIRHITFYPEKAAKMYEIITNTRRNNKIFECIKLYPFNIDYYIYVLAEFGSCDGKVKKLASYYGMSDEFDIIEEATNDYIGDYLKNNTAEDFITKHPHNKYYWELLENKLSPEFKEGFLSQHIECGENTYTLPPKSDDYMNALDFISFDDNESDLNETPVIKKTTEEQLAEGKKLVLEQKYNKAAEIFINVANEGKPEGLFNLFDLYQRDRRRVIEHNGNDNYRYVFANDIEAAKWFLNFPINEMPIATFYAAMIYYIGFVGKKDFDWIYDKTKYYQIAYNYFIKCHNVGLTRASNMLGYMLCTKKYVLKGVHSCSKGAEYFQYVINNATDSRDIADAKTYLSVLVKKNNKWVKPLGAKMKMVYRYEL